MDKVPPPNGDLSVSHTPSSKHCSVELNLTCNKSGL